MLLPGSIAMTIACSLELRVLFPVQQLVEIALCVSQRFHQPRKWLPRQVCAGLFSSGSLNRPKQGFVLLMASWISQQLQGLGVRSWSLVVLGEYARREQMP